MAYTLGQVVSTVFNRSPGQRPAQSSAPLSTAVPAQAPMRPRDNTGVVVTLSPQARQILANMEQQTALLGTKRAGKAIPKIARSLDLMV